MKAILSMLVVLMSVSAAKAALTTAQIQADVDAVLKTHKAVVTDEQRKQLEIEYDALSLYSKDQLTTMRRVTALKKFATCRLADGVIIINGVGEAMPMMSFMVRESNAAYMTDENILVGIIQPDGTVDAKRLSELAQKIADNSASWGNFFGGGLESVFGVSVEALTSYDQVRIESEIQKAFPGTQMIALKMKGENSVCGQATLKLDMIKAMLLKK